MPMYTKSGRSLWPVLVGALVVLVVVLGSLLVVAATRGDDREGPTPAAPSLMPTPTTEPHEGQDADDHGDELGEAPTGCLAGPAVDAEMVVSTQARAPHTAYGAVEVAASFMRWTNRYPFPDAAQIATIEDNVLSAEMPAELRDLAAGFALIESNPQLRADTPPGHPFGTPFTVSTRPGAWLVDPTSTDDRVTVHLSVGLVVDGTLSAETYGMGSPVLVWEDDAWRVVDTVPTETAALEAGGVTFLGGC